MHSISAFLAISIAAISTQGFSTIVPIANEVVATTLKSEGRTHYLDGYVQLNRTDGTLSLILQPLMPPCPVGNSCPEVMPAPFEYFLEGVTSRVDECDAIIYEAEQTREHSIRVLVIDNTRYNYEQCPTFLPVPETLVQVEQNFYGPSSTDTKRESFGAAALAPLRY